jgi:hypothetical protein
MNHLRAHRVIRYRWPLTSHAHYGKRTVSRRKNKANGSRSYMKVSSTRNLIFIAIVAFFISSLAIALHHHDIPMQGQTCSICKMKGSASGTYHKAKINIDPAFSVCSPLLTNPLQSILLLISISQDSLQESPYLLTVKNKAPPIQL